MSENELKPCPFCGGEAVARSWPSSDGETWYVGCDDDNDCPCESHACFGEDRAEALAAWNTRKGEEQAVKAEQSRLLSLAEEIVEESHTIDAWGVVEELKRRAGDDERDTR
jgi:ssDNA-binding Zn-finger/Zn-ribbon topoisomerase 1